MTDDHRAPSHGIFSQPLTRRQIFKGAAVIGAGAALAPALAACGGGETTTSASPSAGVPKKGGSLKSGITTGSGKDGFDPHALAYEPEIAAGFQLYDRLLDLSPDAQVIPGLAEEATPNADATVWTVRLKPDVLFSDGKPVTADDVIFSFNRIIDPKSPKTVASSLSDLKPSGMKKLDDRTVRFTLSQPNAVFTEILAEREANIVRADWNPKNPIGTGPFKLKSYTPGQQMVFEPNENYWSEGPYVDELTLVQYADPVARVNALLSGAIDHCDQLDSAQVKIVNETTGYAAWMTKSPGFFPFTMNVLEKPFTDVRARQAFRLIVDRQPMIDQAYGGYGWLGNDMYAPYDPGYPADLPQRQQDLEQAKSLLKQAGYEGLKIELNTSDAVGAGAVSAAQVFAEQAKGAGVDVKVMKRDSNVFYGDQYTKWGFAMDYWGSHNYLIYTTLGWLPGAPYDETHFYTSNPKWLAIVQEAFRTPDDTKRNDLVKQAGTIDYNEGSYIVWAFNELRDGYSQKLGGLVNDVFQSSAMGFRYHLVYYK